MFSKPRPVPSKAALKFIYQLAYISSGTAVGVATLCAEERRRRTHVVQKIADNAKRLRQSPRHVHNAAALAEREEDLGHQDQNQDQGHSLPNVKKTNDAKMVRNRYTPLVDRSAHAPELPSFVKRGYGQLAETDHKRSRRRRSGEPMQDEDRTSRRMSDRTTSPHTVRHRAGTSITRGSKDRIALRAAAESWDKLFKEKIRSTLDRGPFATDTPQDLSLKDREHASLPVRSAGASQKRGLPDTSTPALTRALVLAEPPTDQPLEAHEAADLPIRETAYSLQLRKVTMGKSSGRIREDEPQLVKMADHSRKSSAVSKVDSTPQLKQAVVAKDDPYEAQSSIESASSFAPCTSSDFDVIRERAHLLATQGRPHDAFQLYAQLLRMPAFVDLSRAHRLELGLSLLVDSIGWDVGVLRPRFVSMVLPLLSSHEDWEAFSATISSFCGKLIDEGRTSSAFDLIRACRFCDKESYLFPAEDTVLGALLDSGSLDRSARVLQSRTKDKHIEKYLPHIERLAVACHQARNHRSLAVCIFRGGPKLYEQLPKLSDEARTSIAIALTTTKRPPAGLFLAFYLSVPKQKRHAIDEARTCSRLHDIWKATRDFDSTWGHYASAKTFAASQNLSMEALRNIELAMVEICNSANRPDRALEILSTLSANSSHSSRSLCILAVTLAKKKSWKQLNDLLHLLESSRALISAKVANRAVNNVIHLYSKDHTAVETWEFVSDMIQKLSFSPNRATTTVMLHCFVSKQALGLMPRWLRYTRTLGETAGMDAWMAADLLKCYYIEQRPPHVLLTDLCRDLIRRVPTFETEKLQTLIKESISYDLRKKDVQDRQQLQEKAKPNMALLCANGISTPGMRALISSRRPGNPTSPASDGTSTPAMQALKDPREAASALRRPSKHFSMGARVEGEDVRAKHAPVQTTDDVELLRDPFRHSTTPSHVPDEQGYGLAAQRREAERAAEERMQQLLHEFNSNELDDAVGSDARTGSPSDGGRVTDAIHADVFRDVRNAAGPDVFTSETSALFEQDTAEDLFDSKAEDKLDYTHNKKRQQRLVRDMLAAFSLPEYRRVIELYHESRSFEGLPASPMALEICVEASLRSQRGNPAEATAIMTAARDAGMNVTCAMAPILLHQMWHSDIADQRNANLLRLTTIDYYRTNAENGWPVKHHVGVTAANILVNKGLPEHGISILNSIYHSEWAQDRGFDVAAMSVYLRAYAALGSDKGLKWSLATVLRQNMRIDRKFLDTVKRAREIYSDAIKNEWASRMTSNYLAPLRRWKSVFSERRERQRVDAKLFGRKLIRVIARCEEVSRQSDIDSDTRNGLEWELYRAPEHVEVSAAGQVNSLTSEVAKEQTSRAVGRREAAAVHRRHRTHRDSEDDTWVNNYRDFAEKGVRMPDGKLASFRYLVDNEIARGQPAAVKGRRRRKTRMHRDATTELKALR